MNELVIGPETELQSTPVVHYGEAPRAGGFAQLFASAIVACTAIIGIEV